MRIRRRKGLPRMVFHVVNRGARGLSIFASDEDRGLFVGLLGKLALKHGVQVISWCLMPNHYHLQLEGEGTPLSEMMRDLDGIYARVFNDRHGTKGCLFQGPFRCMAVPDDRGIREVSRYIHRNPLPLGVNIDTYPWSSCPAFLGFDPVPRWLNPSRVLESMGRTVEEQRDAYRRFLYEPRKRRRKGGVPKDEVEDFYGEHIRILEERYGEGVVDLQRRLGRVSLRTVVSWAAHALYRMPAPAVASFFGYRDASCVRSLVARFQGRLQRDPELRVALESVCSTATQYC